MTALDRLAVTAFAGGDSDTVVEQVIARATAICAADGHEATARTLARRTAATEAVVELIDALIGKSVINRDFEIVPHLERLSRMYSARLTKLVEADALHRRLACRSAVTNDAVVVR